MDELDPIYFRITAPHFCAGGSAVADRVTSAAPILRWMLGKQWTAMKAYCARKGWTVEEEDR